MGRVRADRLDCVGKPQHGPARQFYHHRGFCGNHGGVAAPAGGEAQFPKELAGANTNAVADLNDGGALSDDPQGAGVVALAKHDLAGGKAADVTVQQCLSQLQRGQPGEHRNARTQPRQDFGDTIARRAAGGGNTRESRHENLTQQILVGGFNRLAGEPANQFVALVDGLLDQRVTGEGPDHVQARHVALVGVAQLRHRIAIVARQVDAASLQEFTGWGGAKARNNAVRGDRYLALQGVYHQAVVFDAVNVRPVIGGDRAGANRALYAGNVTRFGKGKVSAAIDDADGIMAGQGQRVFDPRVAGADDDNLFFAIFFRVAQLVLYPVHVCARHGEFVQIALQADRQRDQLGLD